MAIQSTVNWAAHGSVPTAQALGLISSYQKLAELTGQAEFVLSRCISNRIPEEAWLAAARELDTEMGKMRDDAYGTYRVLTQG